MALSDRIRAALANGTDLSQSGLAKACGISRASVNAWVNGKTDSIDGKYLTTAAYYLGVSAHWLSTGEGPMLPGAGEPAIIPPVHANTSPGPAIRGKVPLISWVQAGDWCHAADPHLPGQADRWMDCPVTHSTSTFALRVRGDSMTAPHGNSRTYPEGCFIFVDPEKRTPDNGDRVVACLTGTDEVTFKIYKNEDGRQWLQPLNPSHEPIRENFHILGTVLGKWEDG